MHGVTGRLFRPEGHTCRVAADCASEQCVGSLVLQGVGVCGVGASFSFEGGRVKGLG